jgi:adenylosuccinate synthase
VAVLGITVVVGGQFGGEGKGKITSHLCRNHNFDIAIRCGGPNSGHTCTIDGEQTVLRQVPVGVVNPKIKLFLAAGCLINLDVLNDEIERFHLTPDRLKIDRNAAIITPDCIEKEKKIKLREHLGSTQSGVGAAVAKRALRNPPIDLVRDYPELKKFSCNVSEEVMKEYHKHKKIVIEGTQGFGLSLYHSPFYPKTTSRDTTASAFLSEVGISPLCVSEIIMVLRTFPIRVAGESGPLSDEISWDIIQKESNYPHKIFENTTVTNTLRRVGRFDLNLVKKAYLSNYGAKIALMGLDYLDFGNKNIKDPSNLALETQNFISLLKGELGTNVAFIGNGPTDFEIIELS